MPVTLEYTNEICPVSQARKEFQQDQACSVSLASQHTLQIFISTCPK